MNYLILRDNGKAIPVIRAPFPVDFLIDRVTPAVACRIGNADIHFASYSMLCGICGIDLAESQVTEANNPNHFYCPGTIDGGCIGQYAVSFPDGSLHGGYVASRTGCTCLQLSLDRRVQNWSDIIHKKYETSYLAACGVARFFIDVLAYAPSNIVQLYCATSGPNATKYELRFKVMDPSRAQTNLKVEINRDSNDGSWAIQDPMDPSCRMQHKHCCVCQHVNRAGAPNFFMKFGFLNCRHVVCELCIFNLYTARPGGCPNMTGLSYFTVQKKCPQCAKPASSYLKTSFTDVNIMPAPTASAYMGKKPLFSTHAVSAMMPFYRSHIDWIVIAFNKDFKSAADIQKELADEIAWCQDPNNAWDMEINIRAEALPALAIVVDAWHDLTVFLLAKHKYVSWALDNVGNFPVEFLDRNAEFYARVLERTRYDLLVCRINALEY